MISIRQAEMHDLGEIVGILTEAAEWLQGRGQPMWVTNELAPNLISKAIGAGEFFLAYENNEVVGTLKLEMEDPLFWPDVPTGESIFVHRLAVRRAFAGRGISHDLLSWAVERARKMERKYLRLDTDSTRPKLCAIYQRFGFRLHSQRQVGPYFVSRYEIDLTTLTTTMTQIPLLSPLQIAESLTEYWSPQVIAELDDMYVKVAKVKGEMAWHAHEQEDELFFILRGEFKLGFAEGEVTLRAGEMLVVPRGRQHHPIAEEECLLMLIERKETAHTGGDVTTQTKSLADQLRWLTAQQPG